MDALLTPVDAYCERLGPGLWAEPLNAVSNLAFLLAAAAVLAGGRGRAGDRRLLGGLMLAVGLGSGLFHTLAVRWAAIADVVPIVGFIAVALWLALVRLVGLGRLAASLAVAGFLVAAPAVGDAARGVMGSSGGYLPAFLALVAVAAAQLARGRPGGSLLAAAAAVFAASLAARMADLPLCTASATGTHFLWHLLNALVLYLIARAILAGHRQPVSVRRGTSTE